MKLEGAGAVVIGGARGMGRAYCEALLEKGAKVFMGDVLNDVGLKTAEELKAKYGKKAISFLQCDVTKDDDVEHFYDAAKEKLGTISISVYTPGIQQEFQWQKTIDVNLCGLIRCTTKALKLMGKNKGGSGGLIFNTSSINGLTLNPFSPVYTATKTAVTAYTRAWAMDEHFGETGVRFNCVCPTSVATDMYDQIHPDWIYYADKVKQGWAENVKKGRVLEPSVVAAGLIRAAEDDSMNGVALRVSHERGTEVYQFDTDHPKQ